MAPKKNNNNNTRYVTSTQRDVHFAPSFRLMFVTRSFLVPMNRP